MLCPNKTNLALKPTTDGRWAHVICGLWCPETIWLDPLKMEPLGNVNKITPRRWAMVCSLCSKRFGVCVQCSHPQCTTALYVLLLPSSYLCHCPFPCRVYSHPLCAQAAGFRMEVKEVRI